MYVEENSFVNEGKYSEMNDEDLAFWKTVFVAALTGSSAGSINSSGDFSARLGKEMVFAAAFIASQAVEKFNLLKAESTREVG